MMDDPTRGSQQNDAPNLEPDVERLHRQILREPVDPAEGRERAPFWLWAVAVGAVFWGGWYLGRTGGTFSSATHVAYASRDEGTPKETTGQNTTLPADAIAAGRQVFTKNCQACHQASGLGLPGVFPPLVGSQWVVGSEQIVVRILLDGLHEPIEVKGATFNGVMPTWRNVLKDNEIAAVATYIRQWSPNSAPAVTNETVAAIRGATSARGKPWTVSELLSSTSTADEKKP
ncbi:MAG: hypothetical protein NVS1B5_02440 [Gemmatimonadaceae bacterium]